MYFEINVSLNGRHFFSTSERSCVNAGKALKVYDEMRKRFPENEGFEVSCTQWKKEGRECFKNV